MQELLRTYLIFLLFLPVTITATGTLDVYWVDVEGGAATLVVTPAGEYVDSLQRDRNDRRLPSEPPRPRLQQQPGHDKQLGPYGIRDEQWPHEGMRRWQLRRPQGSQVNTSHVAGAQEPATKGSREQHNRGIYCQLDRPRWMQRPLSEALRGRRREDV